MHGFEVGYSTYLTTIGTATCLGTVGSALYLAEDSQTSAVLCLNALLTWLTLG